MGVKETLQILDMRQGLSHENLIVPTRPNRNRKPTIVEKLPEKVPEDSPKDAVCDGFEDVAAPVGQNAGKMGPPAPKRPTAALAAYFDHLKKPTEPSKIHSPSETCAYLKGRVCQEFCKRQRLFRSHLCPSKCMQHKARFQ